MARERPSTLNGDGYLAGITNPAGETHSFTYHGEAGLLATHTDPGGSLSQYTYDALGHLVRSDDPAGGFKVLSRTKLENAYEVAVRTAEDRTTTYRVEILPAGEKRRTTTFPCGCQNEALTRTDGSRTITFSDGAVITEVLGPDPRWGMQAPLQTSLSIRLPEGTTSTQTRTRTVVLDDPQDLMSLISQTDTMTINGRVYISTYDAASQTTTMTSPEGRQITEQIDAQGKLLQKQTAALYPLKMAYDADGRLLTATEGIGAETRTINASYNSQGYLSNFSDSLGRTEQYAYDAAGRLTQKLLPAGAGIGFAYDLQGNLISITPPGQPSHTFAHTAAGKIAAYTPPHIGTGSTTIEHTYNADHQMTQINWPDEKALEFGYDAAGRKASMTIPRGTYTYGYDGTTGMLTTMASPDGGILSLVYDGALMRGMTWSGTVAGSIALTRDNQFNITSHSVNGGATVLFEYDNDGLLTKAGELSISRDAQTGFVTGSELGVVTEAMSYNNFGELSRYAVTQGAGTLYDARYSYDPVGRINRYVENIGGVTETYDYTYDVAGRLAEVHKNGERVASYEYDLNGNRLTAVDGVGYAEGEYDAQDRLLSYGDRSYTYGAGGELSSKTEGSSMTTGYSYDELGNLMSVTLPSSSVVEYVVDGRNRRIGKKVNGTLVQGFLYKDLLNPIAELNGSNDVVSRFVYGTKPNVPDYMEKNGVVYRIISDHLGSVRLVVNAEDGSVIQRIDYDAFGNVLNDTFEGFQPFGFAGGLYDTHTRLVRFGVRDYDSVIGRWTTRDPIGFASESVNLYGYVGNDPVNLVDPTGRYFWWIALGTAGLFATGFEVSRDFRDIRDLFNYLKDKLEPQVIDLSDVTEVPEPKASRFAPDRPRAYGFGGDPLPPIECN
jgi:RHS repeat-associated protein